MPLFWCRPCQSVSPSSSVERLLDRNISVVLVDRGMPEFAVSQVLSNNDQGAYDAATYLLDLGHRHIGVIDSGEDGEPNMPANPATSA